MRWLRPAYTLSQLVRRDPFNSTAFCHGPFAAPLVYSLLRTRGDSHQTNESQQQQQQSAASSAAQQTQVQDSRTNSWMENRRRHKQPLHHLRFHHDPLSLFDSISPFSSPLTSLLSQPLPFWPGFGRAAPEMRVDFFSTPSTYSVHAAVPGLDKRDIKVTVEDGILKIEAEKREEKKERSPSAASSSTSLPVNGQQTAASQATPQQGSSAAAAAEKSSASPGGAASTASTDSSAGEKAVEAEDQEESVDYHHVESYYGRVQRSLALPEDADVDRLTARYENGVIKIDIPRLAQHKKQPRRIDIQ